MQDFIRGFVLLTLMSALASLAMAVLVIRRRHVPGARALGVMMLAAAWWCATYAGELLAATEATKDLMARWEYLGIVLIGPCWLLFALRYSGKLQRASWTHLLPFVVPALIFAAALGGEGLGLIWSGVALKTLNGVDMLVIAHGPVFWLNLAYCYACLVIGAVVLMATVLAQVRPLTSQGTLLVLAVAVPWVANVVTLLVAAPRAGLDLTPPSFVLSGALVAVSVVRYGALRVFPGMVPAARDSVIQGMRDGVLVVGYAGVVLSANPAAERLLGGDIAGRDLREAMGGLPEHITFDGDRSRPQEYAFETVLGTDGDRRYVEVMVSPLAVDPLLPGFVLSMRDVTERHQLQKELEHSALHDVLTGLPNRALFRAQLTELLDLRRRNGGQVALLMLDLDHFKDINDTFGHAIGDNVLRETSRRLREALRESDLVARLGGDEFAVALPDSSSGDAVKVGAALREALAAPVTMGIRRLRTGASVGVAVAPRDGTDSELLVQHADVALYLAKASPRGVFRYDPDLDPNSPGILELLDDLRVALDESDVVMHYQPIVSCADRGVLRMEALARWPRPDGTVIAGGDLVPLVARCGLLDRLTTLALHHALATCRAWEAKGWRTAVAVNLSAEDLRDAEIVRRVQRALDVHEVGPERLWLEITETSVMTDPDNARSVLTSLQRLGVRVSIDDFGVGQSSLAYVRTLPAVDLKIDRSFTLEVGEHDGSQAIVRATVALGHDLGLTVTGEGVEDEASFETLRSLGCDAAQGFGIALPMTAEAALRWARRRHAIAPC